jgi:hypothetical protein
MFSAALPLSKLLGGDIRSLDMGVRNKEFLGSREERLGNFTVYVSLPPFFILEGVKDAKRSRPNFEANHAVVPVSASTSGRAD